MNVNTSVLHMYAHTPCRGTRMRWWCVNQRGITLKIRGTIISLCKRGLGYNATFFKKAKLGNDDPTSFAR